MAGVAGRRRPGFVTRWREEFGASAADFTPIDYLGSETSLRHVIAAGWLFRPVFVEYRGCIKAVTEGDDVEELTDEEKKNIDHWYEYFDGDITKTEAMINLFNVNGVFASLASTEPYDEEYRDGAEITFYTRPVL